MFDYMAQSVSRRKRKLIATAQVFRSLIAEASVDDLGKFYEPQPHRTFAWYILMLSNGLEEIVRPRRPNLSASRAETLRDSARQIVAAKTTSFVLPALCHDFGASCIAADMKGDLAVQTGEHRERVLGQNVIYVNPAHQFGKPNMPYNPMQIILDDLQHAPQDVISDAPSMATQIHAEAPGGDRDPLWPNGTRKMLVFAVVAQCAMRDEHDAHLPRVYEVLGDDRLLDDLLSDATDSDVLGGELAAMARNIKNVWDENPTRRSAWAIRTFRELLLSKRSDTARASAVTFPRAPRSSGECGATRRHPLTRAASVLLTQC